ncbi:nucleoside-diphosphate sugar epimerase/dehydratase [Halomonas sp. LR5S13]|uniref:polysaccharide biosynthesis protein n=1 Tax=Halomonas rhizosphaerae TaxID=3043296 RepID=UPI0024A7BAAE|nr:nucleoside-diphosphate sugar epimerase/dehydratase [Halomonas rhizosphaerae]MDI5921871.1 nucleoside-diphosphate sugar epimerase/dehydratase [Halomonas rhizosphaerae]
MMPFLPSLFGLPRKTKRYIQVLADTILITFSLILAMLLRRDSLDFLGDPEVWVALLILVPASIFIFIRFGFYRTIIRFLGFRAAQTILGGVLSSAFVLGMSTVVLGLPITLSVSFIYAMIALISIGGVRFVLCLLYSRGQQLKKTRVLIYGAGVAGRQLVMSLRHGRDYEPVAYVDFAPRLQGTNVQGLKVYHPRETHRIIKTYGVEKFLLAIPEASRSRRQEVIESVEILGMPVQTIPDMADIISGKAKVNELRDVAIEDLLGRDPIPPDLSLLGASIYDKVVMVTGAGGSIGSELSRQIFAQHPKQLLLVDVSEYALYRIEQDLKRIASLDGLDSTFLPILASVQEKHRLEGLMHAFQVDTIYHAAAYKHVPLVEQNMVEGICNNVFGTLNMARAAIAAKVSSVVLVSTDKAVRPTNVMGASKRLAELVCQALAQEQEVTRFSMVRFGNVLGSSGSVVPLFRKQIEKGGPITVTHPEITRYFMTIPEAAQLVIQAGAMARGGDVFVLDMGKPVKIVELACRMVRLTGLEPYFANQPEGAEDNTSIKESVKSSSKGDIPIVFTGLRPGEKLYEELLVTDSALPTSHPRIMTANESMMDWEALNCLLERLYQACREQDVKGIRRVLDKAPTGYSPMDDIVDIQWLRRSIYQEKPFPMGAQSVNSTRPCHQGNAIDEWNVSVGESADSVASISPQSAVLGNMNRGKP